VPAFAGGGWDWVALLLGKGGSGQQNDTLCRALASSETFVETLMDGPNFMRSNLVRITAGLLLRLETRANVLGTRAYKFFLCMRCTRTKSAEIVNSF